MGVKLKSASINQTLQLALRASFVALIALWMRSSEFSVGVSLLFISLILLFYMRKSLHARSLLTSAIVLAGLAFFAPTIEGIQEFVFIATWGVLYFLLLNIKELVIVNRKEVYRFLHLILIAFINILFFVEFSFIGQIILFITFIFLFREFYPIISGKNEGKFILISATEAYLSVQVAWAVSFLSINFIAAAAILTLYIYIFHDLTTHYLLGNLNEKIRVRNGLVFIFLTILILIFSA